MNVKPGDLVELVGAEGVWRVADCYGVTGGDATGSTAWVTRCDSYGAGVYVSVGDLCELPDIAFTRLVEEVRRERQAR